MADYPRLAFSTGGYILGALAPVFAIKGLAYLATSNFTDNSFFGDHISTTLGLVGAFATNYALASNHGGTLMNIGSTLASITLDSIRGEERHSGNRSL